MKKSFYNILLICLLASACSRVGGNGNPTDTTGNGLHPVETLPKVAPSQQPAFAGQTRVQGAHTTSPFHANIITSSLNRPWGLAFLPDGRMIVSERPGSIRIVTASGVVGNAIANVPAVRNAGE